MKDYHRRHLVVKSLAFLRCENGFSGSLWLLAAFRFFLQIAIVTDDRHAHHGEELVYGRTAMQLHSLCHTINVNNDEGIH